MKKNYLKPVARQLSAGISPILAGSGSGSDFGGVMGDDAKGANINWE